MNASERSPNVKWHRGGGCPAPPAGGPMKTLRYHAVELEAARDVAATLEVGEEARILFIDVLREARWRRWKLQQVLLEICAEGLTVRCDGSDGYNLRRWRPGAEYRAHRQPDAKAA